MIYKNKTERDAWRNMIHACLNPKHSGYPFAGARGAKVADAWRCRETGFEQFKADVGEKPSNELVLSRIDPAKDYVPGNVAWLPHNSTRRAASSQSPRKANVVVEWQGRRQTLSQWADEIGIKRTTMYNRYGRLGYRGEQLMNPSHGRSGQAKGFNKNADYLL